MIIALIVVLSIIDAVVSGIMIDAGIAQEANIIYPIWLLTNPWIRGIIALLAALWFRAKGWTWLLWIWMLLLVGIVIWNGGLFMIWKVLN